MAVSSDEAAAAAASGAPRTPSCRALCAWLPIFGTSSFGLAVQAVPDVLFLIFLGHVSLKALAAVALANVYAYGIVAMLCVGLDLSQSALTSQAVGSRSYVAVYGWTMMRVALDLALTCAISLPVFLTASALLSHLGLGGTVDFQLVDEYLRLSLPVPFLLVVINASATQLVSIQRIWQPLVIEILYALSAAAAGYIFIIGVDFGGGWTFVGQGHRGAAYAYDATCLIALILYGGAYLIWSAPPDAAGDEEDEDAEDEDEDAAELLAAAAGKSVGVDGAGKEEAGLPSDDRGGEEYSGGVGARAASPELSLPLLAGSRLAAAAILPHPDDAMTASASLNSSAAAPLLPHAEAAKQVESNDGAPPRAKTPPPSHEEALAAVSCAAVLRFLASRAHWKTFLVMVSASATAF